MVYTKTVWTNSAAPGISAPNLNNLETQYDAAVIIGEIKMYGGTTAPTNFFLCNGTSKASATYPALFAVTSHYYGGDATWFHLPNLMGKFPAGYSTDAGSTYGIGITAGTSESILTLAQMPTHHHHLTHFVIYNPAGSQSQVTPNQCDYDLSPQTQDEGGSSAHDNRPPFVVVNYIIRYQ